VSGLVLIPKSDVDIIEVDDEAIIFELESGALHWMDAPALLLWRCLDGESTMEEICADIADELGIDVDVVQARADETSAYLLQSGLAVDRDHPAPHVHSDACGCKADGDALRAEMAAADQRLFFDRSSL
jgi:hypothetical protein